MWKVNLKIPISKLSSTWAIFYTSLIQDMEFCNMRGDDIFNVNQIVINESKDLDKAINNNRRKKFIYWIRIEDDKIRICDIGRDQNLEVMEIEFEKSK